MAKVGLILLGITLGFLSEASSAGEHVVGSIERLSATEQQRETQLTALLEIRSDQESAWKNYLSARRTYLRLKNKDQRKQVLNLAMGLRQTTADRLNPDSTLLGLKNDLRSKFTLLYDVLNPQQRYFADTELDAAECGR